MKATWCILGLFLIKVLAPLEAVTAVDVSVGALTCEPSPTNDLLPDVVAPMTGTSPAWMVDGSTTWSGEREPVKTLWVLRRTSDSVRISGRRLDGPGVARLRRGSDTPSETLLVANPSQESVMPGGAPQAVMRAYVFLPSHVFYPSPGCWQFTVQIAQEEFRIVRDLRVGGPAPVSFVAPLLAGGHPTAVHNVDE
jgi:hypothetical protein